MKRRVGVVIDPLELDEKWVGRILNGGIDILGLHPNPKDSSPERMRQWFRRDENQRFLDLLTEYGVDIEWEAHVMSWLLPREHFETNPHWFRMNEGGKRTADFNLCCSCADALEVLRENARQLAQLLPSTSRRYHFWLDDVASGKCHCPQCRDLSAADQAMIIYNAILHGIRRFDPEATACYLAYHDTNALPQKVAPQPGIFLEYAPFERDHKKSLGDGACQQNQRETQYLKELLDLFGAEQAQVLDYWLDNSLFSGWTKPPKAFQMQRNVLLEDAQYYGQMGFHILTTFACYLGKEYTDLYPEPEDPVIFGKLLKQEHI